MNVWRKHQIKVFECTLKMTSLVQLRRSMNRGLFRRGAVTSQSRSYATVERGEGKRREGEGGCVGNWMGQLLVCEDH